MTKRRLSWAIALLCAATLGAHAQTPAPSASPKKSDPTGLGLLSKDRPKNAKTEITAKGEATFDNTTGIATFTTNVFVKDPQFNLYCDKLTVYLNKERKGIERAEAEGKVVIVQENTNDKGEVVKSIGRAGKAVFVPATGDATLTATPGLPPEGNWPQLQQGINNQVATDEKTVMILNRAGRLKTIGPSRVVLIDADKAAQ